MYSYLARSALYLPHSPTRTTSVICRKPWYTPDEEIIMVNRILRDDPAKGFTSKKELALNFRDLITAWRDWALWGFFLISVIAPLPILPIKTYLHLNIKRLGFTTFQANMLSVPHSLLQIFTILGLVWSSSHFNERTWHCVFGAGFVLPLLSALVGLSPSGKHWERYTLATLVASGEYDPEPYLSIATLTYMFSTKLHLHRRSLDLRVHIRRQETRRLRGHIHDTQSSRCSHSISCVSPSIYHFPLAPSTPSEMMLQH